MSWLRRFIFAYVMIFTSNDTYIKTGKRSEEYALHDIVFGIYGPSSKKDMGNGKPKEKKEQNTGNLH